MINEFLKVIEDLLDDDLDRVAMDKYSMSPGFYFKADSLGNIIEGPIEYQRGSSIDPWYLERDYYSQAIPGKELDVCFKRVRTNNIYSLGFTVLNMIEHKSINKMFDNLSKYQIEKSTLGIYAMLNIQPLSQDMLDKQYEIFMKMFDNAIALLDSSRLADSHVVKIFMDEPIEKYKYENLRYQARSIFNSNDHNHVEDNKLYGTSNFQFTLNGDKPYLNCLDMPYSAPAYVDIQSALRLAKFNTILIGLNEVRWSQKPFDYYIYLPFNMTLEDLSADNRTLKDKCGVRVILERGKKGISISSLEYNIGGEKTSSDSDSTRIPNQLQFKPEQGGFREMTKYQAIVNYLIPWNILSKPLTSQVYSKAVSKYGAPKTYASYLYADRLREYFFEGGDFEPIMKYLPKLLHKYAVDGNALYDLDYQRYALNTYLYLYNKDVETKGGNKMEVKDMLSALKNKCMEDEPAFETDREFMFACGQLYDYLQRSRNTMVKTSALYGKILKVKTVSDVKKVLKAMMDLYGHSVPILWQKYSNLCSMIFAYEPVDEIITDDMEFALMTGLYSKNMLFEKKDKTNNDNDVADDTNVDEKEN